MATIEKLASAAGRRDEALNLQLAQEITAANDKKAVKELVDNLHHKNAAIQSNCIKVLYEIGALKPALIAAYANHFLTLLQSKNNRLQWGAMTTLHAITAEKPDLIYAALPQIISVAEKGSVITYDHCMGILIKLAGTKEYGKNAFSLLLERLMASPVNQLPMYAEQALPVVNKNNQAAFVKVLVSRLEDIEKDTKRKRVEKVIKKLSGK